MIVGENIMFDLKINSQNLSCKWFAALEIVK